MKLISIIFIILLLALPVVVAAEGPAIGSAEDNACNAGGPLAGKCVSDWHWVCGWYLARFYNEPGDNGLTQWEATFFAPFSVFQPYGTYAAPEGCVRLLPPIPWQSK